MKHRISPATAIACVALFFSLGGVGIAASGYRITSIWQIKPSVRHELRGAQGPTGPHGLAGPRAPNSIVGTALWFAPPAASVAQSAESDMTADQPGGSASATCPDGSYVYQGGYTGNNEIVTVDAPNALAGPDAPPGWNVDARLIPGQVSGWVIAWAICVPLLPPD